VIDDSVFHLQDKREIPTPIPLKTVVSCIPAGDFWSIQKGIVVARRYVISIDGKGLYTMSDGMQFTGRGRNPAEHKRRAEQLRVLPARSIDKDKSLPFGLLDRCKRSRSARSNWYSPRTAAAWTLSSATATGRWSRWKG